MKIGDVVYIRGTIDEIRKDTIIIHNAGGYFGTVESEIVSGELRTKQDVLEVLDRALTLMDAEGWAYCDYLLDTFAGTGNVGEYQRHVSAVVGNIRERLQAEFGEENE